MDICAAQSLWSSPMKRWLFYVLVLGTVTACSPQAAPEMPSADHPASPQAPAVTSLPRSKALDGNDMSPPRRIGMPEHMTMSGHEGMKHESDAASDKAGEQVARIYTCPMHPEIRSDKPGNCPKCGMPLRLKARNDAGGDSHEH
jgi:hypothetical protein